MWLFMLHFCIRAGSWTISNTCRRSWTSRPQRRTLTKGQKCFTSVSSKLLFYLCMFHMQTHSSLSHLPLDPVPFPLPCNLSLLQKFEASPVVRGCHLKKQCLPHPVSELLRKTHPRAWFLKLGSVVTPRENHLRRISCGLRKHSANILHSAWCPLI